MGGGRIARWKAWYGGVVVEAVRLGMALVFLRSWRLGFCMCLS